jgi:hypothetical protein
VGKRHRRIRAHGTTGQVAGAATEKSGSKPIALETACPAYVLPKAPRPGQRTVGPKPDVSGFRVTVSCREERQRVNTRPFAA